MSDRTQPEVSPPAHWNFWQSRGAHRRRFDFSMWRITSGALAATGLAFLTVAAFGSETAFAATPIVNLGTAASYAVLAGTTITNTGSSVISGDIGLSPGTSITGFPPGVQSSGVTHIADAQALLAENDLTAAYLDAAGRTPFNTVSGDLGGTTLVPGVYKSASSLALTGALTLNGGGDNSAVFVFQAGSTLTTATGSSVILENGAQACNVFWQVGSSATLGTTTRFSGTILSLTSATLDTGATLAGRVLARNGAVTIDGGSVTVPTCSTATTTTSTSTTSTTSTSTTTSLAPVTTTTAAIIPTGSPATGFGGTAGSGSSPAGPIGFSALALAGLAGAMALRARRR